MANTARTHATINFFVLKKGIGFFLDEVEFRFAIALLNLIKLKGFKQLNCRRQTEFDII